MKKNIFPIILALLLASCLSRKNDELTITGNLTEAANQKIVLKELGINETKALDSATLGSDGGFSFRIADPDTGFLFLQTQNKKYIVIVCGNTDKIRLTGSFTRFPQEVSVEGSEETRDLQMFFKESNINSERADSIMALLHQHVDSLDYYKINLKTDSLLNTIWLDQRKLGMDYIAAHPKSISSLIVINYTFGMQAVISLNDDYAVYKNLADSLKTLYPNNKHVVYFLRTVDNYKKRSRNLAP